MRGSYPHILGGWTFNDPPTQHIFSDMVASTSHTQAFLASALSIIEQYAFDGLDIDWEVSLPFHSVRHVL